ncbi:MAG TPA: cyclic nucleotide-binding domain-containing protein [Nitrospirota bacterium]
MTSQEILQNTMLFKGCGREELVRILGLFQERQINQNTIIFTENMHAEALYIVKSGSVRISIMAGEGEELGLLVLGPGEFFGELALVQEGNRMVTARAETPVELLLLTRKDFQAMIELAPWAAARALMVITKLLAMRVKTYSEKLKELLAP